MGLYYDPDTPVAFGSRQGVLIALQVFFLSISLIIYVLRLYTRAHILRSIGNDDYIMGLAVVLSVTLAINACVSTKYGWGKHRDEVTISDLGPILFFTWLSELFFTLSTSLVKISILLFYLRIAVTPTYRRIIYASIALISAWAIAFSAVVIFQCHPVNAYWDPLSYLCFKPQVPMFIHGLTNSLTDVWIYILPMKMVWETQLPKRQRIGLIVIFGAGFFACVAGALRLYYLIRTEDSNDSTWEGFNLWTWESIEVNLGIVCASAPCLKALVVRLFPKYMASHNASGMSRTVPHHQMNGRRQGKDRQDYDLENMRDLRRERNQIRISGDSQEGLTKVRQHVLIAQVDADRLV